MITTEEIAIKVYQMLQEHLDELTLTADQIDYERNDYGSDGIIVIPHDIDGEGSVRNGQINVNIHVPDVLIENGNYPVYRIDYPRLIELKKAVIEVLKRHFEVGSGYSWSIGLMNPPIKEPDHNEHFVSIALEITVRNKNNC